MSCLLAEDESQWRTLMPYETISSTSHNQSPISSFTNEGLNLGEIFYFKRRSNFERFRTAVKLLLKTAQKRMSRYISVHKYVKNVALASLQVERFAEPLKALKSRISFVSPTPGSLGLFLVKYVLQMCQSKKILSYIAQRCNISN